MAEFLVQNILRRRLNTLYPSDYIGDGRYVYIYMDIASPVVGSDAHTKNCKWKRLEEIERIVDSVSGIRNALIHFGQMAHSCRFSAAASRQAAPSHMHTCALEICCLWWPAAPSLLRVMARRCSIQRLPSHSLAAFLTSFFFLSLHSLISQHTTPIEMALDCLLCCNVCVLRVSVIKLPI